MPPNLVSERYTAHDLRTQAKGHLRNWWSTHVNIARAAKTKHLLILASSEMRTLILQKKSLMCFAFERHVQLNLRSRGRGVG